MAITVKDKIFNLETENTLYQMKIASEYSIISGMEKKQIVVWIIFWIIRTQDFPEISMKQKMKEPIL